jgi:hypothetical protein
MTTWQSLPVELQLRDADLVSLSLQDIEALFKQATKLGVVDQFAELFWDAMSRVRNKPDNVSIQRCVEFLEERKRTLGRACAYRYNSPYAKRYFAIRYNECEYNIRWLVEQYNCGRKSSNYLMEVE